MAEGMIFMKFFALVGMAIAYQQVDIVIGGLRHTNNDSNFGFTKR